MTNPLLDLAAFPEPSINHNKRRINRSSLSRKAGAREPVTNSNLKPCNMFKSNIKNQAHDKSKPRQSVIDTLSDLSDAKIGLGLAARTASPASSSSSSSPVLLHGITAALTGRINQKRDQASMPWRCSAAKPNALVSNVHDCSKLQRGSVQFIINRN
ncbi:uncharacterized [Tachysurus ichikawai]